MTYDVFILLISISVILILSYLSKRVGQSRNKKERVLKDAPNQKLVDNIHIILLLSVIILPYILGFHPVVGVVLSAVYLFIRGYFYKEPDVKMFDENGEEIEADPYHETDGLNKTADEKRDESAHAGINIVRITVGFYAIFAILIMVSKAWFSVVVLSIVLYWGFKHIDAWFRSKCKAGETSHSMLSMRGWYYLIRIIAFSLAGVLITIFAYYYG